MAIQMGSQLAEQVAVKTDEFGRPVCFLRACDDNGDEVIIIDGWAGHWSGREGEQNAAPDVWVVTALGIVYDLHHLARHDSSVMEQVRGGVWTATIRIQ